MATKTKKRRKTSSNNSDVVTIDFRREVEGGGAGVRIPENDYAAKIVKAKFERSAEKDTPGIRITFKITEGKYSGKKVPDSLWITPRSLWRIRSLLEALGVEVPKSILKLPLKPLVGKDLGITVTDDEPYNGRIKSRVSDFLDLETLNDEVEDEEEEEEDEEEGEEEIEDSEDDDEDEEEDEEEEDEGDEEEDAEGEEDDELDTLDLENL